jgi:hypothetical protein
MRMWFLFVPVLLFVIPSAAYSFEPIPITISHTMDEVIFDGKWTHESEWKASSLNTYIYDDDAQIILRSAHQENFVYIHLNPTTDHSVDLLEDYAVVCFDTKNNKSTHVDDDDYCFMTVLAGDSFVYKGSIINEFEEIPIPEEFIGVGSVSDHNDRYTSIPHPSYEFRIPTDVIGRESVYGFFFVVYDANLQKTYTYPQDLFVNDLVPSPNTWGEIYSPDKSLPEFDWPLASLVLSFGIIMILARLKHRIFQETTDENRLVSRAERTNNTV